MVSAKRDLEYLPRPHVGREAGETNNQEKLNMKILNRILNLIPLIVVAFLIVAGYAICNAAETAAKTVEIAAIAQSSPFQKGAFTVNPFTSVRITDSKAEYGGGMAGSYALSDRLAVEGEALVEEIDDSNWSDTVKEVGGGLKYYFPIKQTGIAPYLIGGYSRDLIVHENRLNLGAGVEYRRGQFIAFADARLDHGFEQELSELGNQVKVRAGVGWRF